MKSFLVSCLMLSSLMFGFNQYANASCDFGSTIFRDSLYGTALGAGVGALVLVANSSTSNIAPNIATSALVGAGLGMVVGVVELSMSECVASRHESDLSDTNHTFSVRPLLGFTNAKLTEFVGGVHFQYQL
jgi:hypothetical protein